MGCGESTVKFLMFVFNLVFALAGATLAGLGVAWYMKVELIVKLFKSHGDHLPISLIVLGTLVFVVAFFGCCGVISENECMLFTFSVFMGLLILLKIVLVTVIFVKKEWVDQAIMEANSRSHGMADKLDPQSARIGFACLCGILATIELVGMVFGCYLANNLRRNYGFV